MDNFHKVFTIYSRLSPFPSIRAECMSACYLQSIQNITHSYHFNFLQFVRKMSSISNIEGNMPSCPGLMVRWMFVPMTTNLRNTSSCTYCRCKSSRRSRGYSSKRTTWFRPTWLSGGMFLHCDTEKSRKDSAGRTPHTCCGLSLLLTRLCPRPGFLVCQ